MVLQPTATKEKTLMPIFLLGLVLGLISGGVTQVLTSDTPLALLVAAIAALLTWLGIATVIALDN